MIAGAAPPRPPVTHPVRAQHAGETVDATIGQLRRANIAFNVPDALHVGGSALIQLRLSPHDSIPSLIGRLDAPGRREGATIRFSKKMEAHLTGIGFRILAVTNETQLVSESQGAYWEWEIEPVDTGDLRLHLTLTAHVPGGDKTIRTFDRTLVVRVTFLHRLSSFVGDNWTWLWTAILVPVAGFFIRRRQQGHAVV